MEPSYIRKALELNRKARKLYTAWFICSFIAVLIVGSIPTETEKAHALAAERMRLADELHPIESFQGGNFKQHKVYERGHNFRRNTHPNKSYFGSWLFGKRINKS